MTVLSKWHKVLEAVKEGRIGVGNSRLPVSLVRKEWYDGLAEATKVPKFVVDPKLYEVMEPRLISDSIKAMIQCNVMRLPFDPMMIECTFYDVLPDETFFLFIKGESVRLFSYLNDLAIVHPIQSEIKHALNEDGKAAMDVNTHWAFLPDSAMQSYQSQEKYDQMAHWVARVTQRLASIAYVITNLQGVEREVIEGPTRLNRKREKSGKPPIPTYTLLRIGHVYKANGEKIDYHGSGIRQVHMRRGHTRRQRYGKELSESRLIYIEPVLVNYRGGDAPQIKVKW